MRRDAKAVAASSLVALEGLSQSGIRPRDWDPDLLRLAAQVDRPPAYALAARTALLRWAMDRGDEGAARERVREIQALYGKVPRWLRGDPAAETAFWLARVDGNFSAAQFLSDAQSALVEPHVRLRAEAAVRLSAHDTRGARDSVEKARSALARGHVAGSVFEKELLDALERDIDDSEAV
jgi:hypothetical protein